MTKITTKLGAAVAVVSLAIVTMAGAAYAAAGPLDGVTAEVNTAKSSLLAFINSTGVQLVFALLIVGVGIALAVKFLRRGVRNA